MLKKVAVEVALTTGHAPSINERSWKGKNNYRLLSQIISKI